VWAQAVVIELASHELGQHLEYRLNAATLAVSSAVEVLDEVAIVDQLF